MFENPFKASKKEHQKSDFESVQAALVEIDKDIESLEHYISVGHATAGDGERLEKLRERHNLLEQEKLKHMRS